MPLISKPSPLSALTATSTAKLLGMTRSQFYTSGIAEWLDYYYETSRNRRYPADKVAQMRYWLTVRKGQIALGVISPTSPILPPPYSGDLDAFVGDDLWGGECQKCGRFAVVHPDTGEEWCPTCNI